MRYRVLGFVGAAILALAVTLAGPSRAQMPNTILQIATEKVPDKVKFSQQIGAQVRLSRDGRLFAMTWSPIPNPRGWVVVLHDRNGWAPAEVQDWHATLIRRGLGIVAMQWWYGTGTGPASEAPADIVYRELDAVLRGMNKIGRAHV